MKRFSLSVFSVLLLILITGTSFAGTLSGFEHELKKDENRENSEKKSRDNDCSDGRNEGSNDNVSMFGELFGALFLYGGVNSWERVSDDEETEGAFSVEPRRNGEALIPFTRIDIAYQNVESDVNAMDYRAELGYGPLGIQARFTHYKEDDPPDDLEAIQIHGLYRMSFGSHMELDWGIGSLIINGMEQHSGLSVTMPLIVHPYDFLGMELRPAWSTIDDNDLQDIELSLTVGWRYLSLKGGYRWFRTGSASLDGPQIGLAAYW